ncbi:hypothetical protein [Streptomyces sp. bgisy100]|uniref:hypothetical protein n=1 Tax=Streptomyces sp. bgisy100 TaxID=3413783 RepID=UPI003D7058E4
MDNVKASDVEQLMTHLRVLRGVESLLSVIADPDTQRWLLSLASLNGELTAEYGRRVLLALDETGKEES